MNVGEKGNALSKRESEGELGGKSEGISKVMW